MDLEKPSGSVRSANHETGRHDEANHSIGAGPFPPERTSDQELEKASEKGLRAQGKDPAAVKAERLAQQQAKNEPAEKDENSREGIFSGFDFSNFMSNMGKENKS